MKTVMACEVHTVGMAGHDQTIGSFLWRAERLYPDTEIVARTHDGIERYDYATYADRTRQLANALEASGVETGDRVATVSWNHHRHFETYFGVPNSGAQLHTINPLLPDHHVEVLHAHLDRHARAVGHPGGHQEVVHEPREVIGAPCLRQMAMQRRTSSTDFGTTTPIGTCR